MWLPMKWKSLQNKTELEFQIGITRIETGDPRVFKLGSMIFNIHDLEKKFS